MAESFGGTFYLEYHSTDFSKKQKNDLQKCGFVS